MTTITRQLADALRPMADCLRDGITLGIRPGTPQAIAIHEALAAYDVFMLGVAEAHSDVTTHVGPDLIETYDEGRASVRGIED